MLLGGRRDAERHVAHAQARVATELRVGGGSTPVLDQEQSQALLRGGQVLLRIDRAQHGVVGDPLVEAVDDAGQRRLAADRLVHRDLLRIRHPSIFGQPKEAVQVRFIPAWEYVE